MQAHATPRRDGSIILLGGIVVIVGLVALILQQTSQPGSTLPRFRGIREHHGQQQYP